MGRKCTGFDVIWWIKKEFFVNGNSLKTNTSFILKVDNIVILVELLRKVYKNSPKFDFTLQTYKL